MMKRLKLPTYSILVFEPINQNNKREPAKIPIKNLKKKLCDFNQVMLQR